MLNMTLARGVVEDQGVRTVTARVWSSWDQLERFRDPWNEILSASPQLSIFSSPEWLAAWWRAYGEGRRLLAVTLHAADDQVVGIAPFYVERSHTSLGGGFAYLRLVGDGTEDSDNLDLIIRPGYDEECAQELQSWIGEQQSWDLICLNSLLENSWVELNLAPRLHQLRWPTLASRTTHYVAPLPNRWEDYLQRLSPEFRPLLTRYPQRLKKQHEVRITRCTQPEQVTAAVESLFCLHQKRWTELGQRGAFSLPERQCFYRELADELLRRGRLELWVLELDGDVAAVQFCVRDNETVYLLQEGFDPRYARHRVGYALRAETLQQFIREGMKAYDFLAGHDAYKLKFGAVESAYVNLLISRPNTLGGVYLRISRSVMELKQWLLPRLPKSLLGWFRERRSAGKMG